MYLKGFIDCINVQLHILDLPLSLVDVETELVQAEFFFEEVTNVVLENVAASTLLDRVRPRKIPRHGSERLFF